MRTSWKKALYFAAREAYQKEVVDTQMKDYLIGEGRAYADEEDWVEQRVRGWIFESRLWRILSFREQND